MRFFRDFLCFRFWQRRRGSGHREGEGHKVINWSKIILDVQLICKKPPAHYSILPHQGECSHFPDMHRRPYPLTLCLCATYVAAFVCHSASDNCLSLLCCSLCRSLCREAAGALLQLLSQKWNIAKWLPCMLHKLGKFMALLWAFHYSTESLPGCWTPAWQFGLLEREALMHLMHTHDQNVGCWQGQSKIMKCHN